MISFSSRRLHLLAKFNSRPVLAFVQYLIEQGMTGRNSLRRIQNPLGGRRGGEGCLTTRRKASLVWGRHMRTCRNDAHCRGIAVPRLSQKNGHSQMPSTDCLSRRQGWILQHTLFPRECNAQKHHSVQSNNIKVMTRGIKEGRIVCPCPLKVVARRQSLTCVALVLEQLK